MPKEGSLRPHLRVFHAMNTGNEELCGVRPESPPSPLHHRLHPNPHKTTGVRSGTQQVLNTHDIKETLGP